MENTLPQRLYVSMEDGGDGDFFPVSNTNSEGLDSGTVVGIYELQDIKTVTTVLQ